MDVGCYGGDSKVHDIKICICLKKKALGKFKSNQNSHSLLGECKLAEPLQKTGNTC